MTQATIKGTCKKCGTKHQISYGSPKWFDDVVNKGLPKNEMFKEFEKLQDSELCINCFEAAKVGEGD